MSADLQQFGRRYSGGASLRFRTRSAVRDEVVDRLTEAAQRQVNVHDWWAGPLVLDATDDEGHLHGSLALALVGYESADGDLVAIDEDTDAFMGFMDLCVAVDWLSQQAAAANLAFELIYGDDAIGSIDATGEDDELESFIVALGEAVGASFDNEDDARAAAIDEAHRDRLAS